MILISFVFISQSFWLFLYSIDAICASNDVICFGAMSYWLWPVFQLHEFIILSLMQYLLFDIDTLKLLLGVIIPKSKEWGFLAYF